jgi:radical SAM protein with 4Fe4S-binding SPASM domain
MVNSVERLAQMKNFVQGELHDWGCRAGHNSLIVRVDGTLAPCFPMYSAGYDWGTIENHKFETKQLKEMKKECQKSCFSTLNHILAFCYNDKRVISGCSGRRSMASEGLKATSGIRKARVERTFRSASQCRQPIRSSASGCGTNRELEFGLSGL